MSPEQMKKKSGEKVKQIMGLMATLHLKVEAKQRINDQGFIENLVFWIDDEKYPTEEVKPTGETAPVETVPAPVENK